MDDQGSTVIVHDLSGYGARLDPVGAVKRVGMVALASDLTTERDMAWALPSDRIGVFVTRVQNENPVTPENLRRMAPRLSRAAELIVPGEPLDVLCYACTSASVVLGDGQVRAAMQSVRPGLPVVTPASAAVAGLRALDARRIAVLTPYLPETTKLLGAYFEAAGFDLAHVASLGVADDRDVARINAEALLQAAQSLPTKGVDALFFSCTALPVFRLAARIEALAGRPVVTSNQATAWALLGLTGVQPARSDLGSLFDRAVPDCSFFGGHM